MVLVVSDMYSHLRDWILEALCWNDQLQRCQLDDLHIDHRWRYIIVIQ